MALITLLRHAPLPFKYQKCFIGHSDIQIDLTLTDISKLEIIKHRKYDYVFSSDLKRCRQTLDLINLDYTKDDKLREVNFKEEFEGKNFDEIEKLDSYDDKYLSSMKIWHEYICQESFSSFENRIKCFLNTLPKDKDILICAHAGSIKMIYSILENEDYLNSFFKIEYTDFVDIYK